MDETHPMAKWTALDIPDLTGRTILITGANSGLGLRSAEALSAKGAKVLMACRNEQKAAVALDSVKAAASGAEPEVVKLDLSDLSSVRDTAAELNERLDSIDVLMNNAGIMAVPMARTADGFESQMGTNHLGHFALTGLLLPTVLAASSPAGRQRVIDRSPHGAHGCRRPQLRAPAVHPMGRVRPDQARQPPVLRGAATSGTRGRHVARGRLGPPRLRRHQPDAGPATGAPGFFAPVLSAADGIFGQSDSMGALPQLYAATMPDVLADDYWGPDTFFEQRGHPTRVGRTKAARDKFTAKQLWDKSEELTGVTYSWS